MRSPLFIALLLSLGCAEAAAPGGGGVLGTGLWGGEGANLVITPDSARAEFVCASGRLEAPIVLDSGGRFDVAGTYRFEAGPVGLPVPARWLGTVTPPVGASRIVLAVVISSPGLHPDTLGPFHLVKDKRVTTGLCA